MTVAISPITHTPITVEFAIDAVLRSVVAANRGGLSDLVFVRRHLEVFGVVGFAQDTAINFARRAGLVTGTLRECREQPTAEQVAANLPDGIGFLSIREQE